MNDVKIFVPIIEIDAAQRLVNGAVTAEKLDVSGEVCDYTSTKRSARRSPIRRMQFRASACGRNSCLTMLPRNGPGAEIPTPAVELVCLLGGRRGSPQPRRDPPCRRFSFFRWIRDRHWDRR
jgi:hypothetical protein